MKLNIICPSCGKSIKTHDKAYKNDYILCNDCYETHTGLVVPTESRMITLSTTIHTANK